MEKKRKIIITLACIMLLCISGGHCSDDDSCPYGDKDLPPRTTCDPKQYDCKSFWGEVSKFQKKLENYNQKALSKQLSPAEAESGLKIVNEYYTLLINTGIPYGKIAREVINNEGEFAQLANVHLKYRINLEGLQDQRDSIINNLRISLAYSDASLRLKCKKGIPYEAIAKYHYDMLRRQGLSAYAWGGTLLQEFAGSGSWMNAAGDDKEIPFKAGQLAAAIACNREKNGIKAREAAQSIAHVPASNLPESLRVVIHRLFPKTKPTEIERHPKHKLRRRRNLVAQKYSINY